MPLYEYECKKCQSRLERLQSMNDDSLAVCPICKIEMKRQVGITSFRLKGSGWYKDGYQKQPSK